MNNVILFIVLLVIVSCTNKHNSTSNNSTSELTEFSSSKKVVKDTIYHKSKFNLRASDIYFEVEITKIDIYEKKNYYIRTKYQYAVPDTILLVDASPVIFFKITNTNEREYNAPIPSSYELVDRYDFRTSDAYLYLEENGTRHKHYSKGISAINCEPIYDDFYRGLIFNFKPYESKEFRVSFDPIQSNIEIVNFTGFHIEFHPPKAQSDYYDIRAVWFLIDLKNKKVIGKNFPSY